jgi:hypothetical protein
MAENSVVSSSSDSWSELLQQSRQALSTLRVDALEELAGRAECMLAATLGSDPIRQRIPRPQGERMPELARELGLLRDLLSASDRNLKVLRGVSKDARYRGRAGEAGPRWVR